jgi:hypothetical protein
MRGSAETTDRGQDSDGETRLTLSNVACRRSMRWVVSTGAPAPALAIGGSGATGARHANSGRHVLGEPGSAMFDTP